MKLALYYKTGRSIGDNNIKLQLMNIVDFKNVIKFSE
jgi:hypothetical protein